MPLKDRYEDLDQCLEDYEVWYLGNQNRVVSSASCLEFLHLASNGLLFLLHGLRSEIVSLRGSRTNVEELDKALNEHTQWYIQNHDIITDVVPMLHFLKKSMDDRLWITHMLRDELRQAEQREAVGSGLWLPASLRP